MTEDTERNSSMARHPAGKHGRRPGVRLVELRPAITEQVLDNPAVGWTDREIAPAVLVLECISCSALLAPSSPLAAAHVESHRGPRWRRTLRDARIRARRRRAERASRGKPPVTPSPPESKQGE